MPATMTNINSREKALKISNLALEKKAEDIRILDMQKAVAFCDYFVIAGAGSSKQAGAIASHIEDSLARQKIKLYHSEGKTGNHWILLDYIDVVVHIFHEDARRFYDLERLWGDAKQVR
jgi:ribosome-associated protein